MDVESLVSGIVAGAILVYILFLIFYQSKFNKKYNKIQNELIQSAAELKMSQEKLQETGQKNDLLNKNLESKAAETQDLTYQNISLQERLNSLSEKIAEISNRLDKESAINQLQHETLETYKKNVALLDADNKFLNEKLETQQIEMQQLQEKAHLQFEKIANKLFEEKSEKFTKANQSNLEQLLKPLKEDIVKFKVKVEETYDKESKQRFSLEEKVKDLIEQTNKVSAEANNLASALKGSPQKRGNWGEMILERILETSGLTKDREYFVQDSFKSDDGSTLRPDVKVLLPDKRMVIIDSKVSLIAYDQFVSSESVEEQKPLLQDHLTAVKIHIDQLSSKKYDDLQNSLDFTMMFIPIEPAYLLAVQTDPDLWAYAYNKRILLVSPTNLIASLKIISDLWKREQQSKNAMKIVKRGEYMYEKLVSFAKTFEEIGSSLKISQEKYDKAMGQLKDGRGNLINQAIKLKSLGLKSDKTLPDELTDNEKV